MSDQMPDEVWVDEDTINGEFYASPQQAMVTDVRYIRADLYEQAGEFDHQGIDPADLGQHFTDAMQALTTRNAVSKAACAQLIAEQAQRAERAEAEAEALRRGIERVIKGSAPDFYEDELSRLLDAVDAAGSLAYVEALHAAKAERDRLRAALESVVYWLEDESGRRPYRAREIAQEALSHD